MASQSSCFIGSSMDFALRSLVPQTLPHLHEMQEADLVVPVPSQQGKTIHPYTHEKLFREFTFRRAALICALTKDEEAFTRSCNTSVFDAGMQSLYLYGHTDGNWVVWQLEELAAPTGKPAPMLGIKLMRRDNTEHLQWLQYIAMHCDAWLIRISFILGANLNAIQRESLFFAISSVPTVLEEFLASDTYQHMHRREEEAKLPRSLDEDDHEIKGEDEAHHGLTICPSCGDQYHGNASWICCVVCKGWCHRKCAKMMKDQANAIDHYECFECIAEKNGHND